MWFHVCMITELSSFAQEESEVDSFYVELHSLNLVR